MKELKEDLVELFQCKVNEQYKKCTSNFKEDTILSSDIS